MPLRHDIPIASDLVFVSGHGAMQPADAAALAAGILADPRLAPRFVVLVRLAEARAAFDPDDVPRAAELATRMTARGLRRTAIVAADDAGWSLGAALEAHAAALDTPIRVFRDDLDAVTWLFAHAD